MLRCTNKLVVLNSLNLMMLFNFFLSIVLRTRVNNYLFLDKKEWIITYIYLYNFRSSGLPFSEEP